MENRLRATIARLEQDDAISWLGFDVPAQRRARYLEVAKKLHPHRWVSHGPEVTRLANEAFIRVQDLYKRSLEPPGDLARGSHTAIAALQAEATPDEAAPRPQKGRDLAGRLADGTGPTVVPSRDPRGDDPHELFERGTAECRAGRFETAFELLHAAVLLQPRNKKMRARMHYARGRVLLAEGKDAEARSDLEWAARLEPEFANARQALASFTRPKKRRWNPFRR